MLRKVPVTQAASNARRVNIPGGQASVTLAGCSFQMKAFAKALMRAASHVWAANLFTTCWLLTPECLASSRSLSFQLPSLRRQIWRSSRGENVRQPAAVDYSAYRG